MGTLKFLVYLNLLLFSATGFSSDLSHQDHLDIIFNRSEAMADLKVRKALYIASELIKTSEQFQKNPEAFKEWKVSPPQGHNVNLEARVTIETPASSSGPLRKRLSALEAEVDGSKIGDSLLYSSILTAASLSGPKGSLLSRGLRLAGKGYDQLKSGKTPDLENLNLVGLGSLLDGLKTSDSSAYEMIQKKVYDLTGINIEGELSDHPAVKNYKTRIAQQNTAQKLDELVKKIKSHTEKSKELESDAEKESYYKNLKSEMNAGFGTASMLASMFGEPEAAHKIQISGQILDKMMTLYASQNNPAGSVLNLGMMAATQNYVAIASMTMSLFADTGDGFEASVMKQMQAIMEVLQELSEKIDKGFLKVNQRLDHIDLKLSQVISEARAYGRVQQYTLGELETEVKKVQSVLNQIEMNKEIKDADTMSSLCLDDISDYQSLDDEVVRDFKKDCIEPIVAAASKNITAKYLSLQQDSPLPDVVSYMYGNQKEELLPVLVSKLNDSKFGHPFYDSNSFFDLVEPSLWLRHSSLFIDLVENYPIMHHKILPKYFDRISNAGENYIKTYQNLMTIDEKNLRIPLIKKILDTYKEGVLDLLRSVRATSFDSSSPQSGEVALGVRNIYGFDTTKDFGQQRSDATWAPKNNFFTRCSSFAYEIGELRKTERDLQGAPVKSELFSFSSAEVQKFKHENNGWNSHHTRLRFLHLPQNLEEFLPNEVTWLLKLDPDNTEVCLGQLDMSQIHVLYNQQPHPFNPKMSFGEAELAETRYWGNVKVEIKYKGKNIMKALFPVEGSFKTEGYGRSPYVAYMHSLGFPIYLPGRTTVTTIFRTPEYSRAQFKYGSLTKFRILGRETTVKLGITKNEFISMFKKEWEEGWDKESKGHFSERNVGFMKAVRENHSALELLYYSLDLGINDSLAFKEKILNQFFNSTGLMSGWSYVEKMIDENSSEDELISDLDSKIETFLLDLNALELEARKKGEPLYATPGHVEAQLQRLEFIKESVYNPLPKDALQILMKQ